MDGTGLRNWLWRNKHFVVCVMVLAAGAIGYGAAARAFGLALEKKPLLLRRPLSEIPDRLGPYRRAMMADPKTGQLEPVPDVVFSAAEVKELDTDQYLVRMYSRSQTGPLVRLSIFYYTGRPDPVPHEPDRCMIAGGAVMLSGESTTLTVPGFSRMGGKLPVRISRFVKREMSPDGSHLRGESIYSFVYFFVANDIYTSQSFRVRAMLLNPRTKYAYFTKVELNILGVSDPEEIKAVASEFLGYAMPEIIACLPDWSAVEEGRVGPEGRTDQAK